ncbi:MAG TPA: hypothetical protein VIF15_07795 [Polyangiaceae bacterium]
MQSPPPGFNPYAPPQASAPVGAVDPSAPPAPLRLEGAFGRAFDVVRAFLFAPFQFGKWFVFGFIVWLVELGEGGTSVPTNFNSFGRGGFGPGGGGGGGSGSGGPMPDLHDAFDWLRDNLAAVVAIGIAATLLFVALTLLFMWLSARGTMMAYRAVALNHARLGEHWKETREAAWSYLGFRLLLAAIGTPISLGAVVWAVWAFVLVAQSGATDLGPYVAALAPPVILLVVVALLLAPINFLGRNLLAPMLLKSGGGLRASWSRVMAVVRTSLGGVVVFLLVRMLIAVVQGIGEMISIYITCCLGALPVIHQVVCAPFHVFERAYTLRVLESLGPEYKLIVDPPPWQPYPQYAQPYPPPYPQQPPPPYGAPPQGPRG